MTELTESKVFCTVIDRSLSDLRLIDRSVSDPAFVSFQIDRLLGGIDMALFLLSDHYYERLFAIRSVLSSFRYSTNFSPLLSALESYRSEALRSV